MFVCARSLCVFVCACACVRVVKILSLFITFYVRVSTVFRYLNGVKLHNKEDTRLGHVRFGIEHKLI